ncbi:MAG: hypothetical protein P0Y66_02485 [Candidatus Kaistia colombiensis]|nr:MAG: hypothetical protein P0Y66_02485 [Kaistia sp.]
MNAPPREIEAVPAINLIDVSDRMGDALHLLEAAWMAAGSVSVGSQCEALRAVLGRAAEVFEKARNEIDAYRAATVVTA